MKKAMIVDAMFCDVAKLKWQEEFEIIPSARLSVSEPVSHHADIGILNICGQIISAPSCFEYYRKKLEPFGVYVHCGKTEPKSNYPFDVAYNIATTKSDAFFKKGTADEVALKIIRENNLRENYVNQGYAKCSCVCLDDAIITHDETIFSASLKNGTECLKISGGQVKLSPYECGFLGGASGFLEDKVYFFGDITKHSDYEQIKFFLEKRNIGIDYIKNYPLVDIGTIFFPY